MDLTVHIGTTKTGTSSIQRFLRDNIVELFERGIYVPGMLGNVIHYYAAIASMPYGMSPDLAKTVPIRDEVAHEQFVEETVGKFQEGVSRARDSECGTCIITSEQLQSRLTEVAFVERFAELFARDFEHVRIVVYVRPQLDQAVSLYSTVLRTGYAQSLTKFLDTRMQPKFQPYFDLRDIIERWTSVFESDNVMVRPYKAKDGNSGVLGDFMSMFGVSPDEDGWARETRANSSINSAGQELLRLVNDSDQLTAASRRRIVGWAEEHCSGPGEVPPRSLAVKFQKQFDESNAWVTQMYFPGHAEYLEPSWPPA